MKSTQVVLDALQTTPLAFDPGYTLLTLEGEPSVIELRDAKRSSRCGAIPLSVDRPVAIRLNTPMESGRLMLRPADGASKATIRARTVGLSQALLFMVRHGVVPARVPFGFTESAYLVGAYGRPNLAEIRATNTEFRYLGLFNLLDLRNEPIVAHPHTPRVVPDELQQVAIYIHLHYKDLWPEFRDLLMNAGRPFALILSMNEADPRFAEQLRNEFPGAEIYLVENRGRDVGPFVHLLNAGRFSPYSMVCKLHGKKSVRGGHPTVLGERMRRACLSGLLNPESVARVSRMFDRDPKLGLVGLSDFLLPKQGISASRFLAREREHLRRLHKRAEVRFEPSECDFFAGTMFWFRPSALELLRRTKIEPEDFACEQGQTGGTLHHATERFFNRCVRHSGFRVAAVDRSISAASAP